MRTDLPNFMEAEKYFRKHLNLPKKVRIKISNTLFKLPADNKHLDIPALRTYLEFEYHGKNANVGFTRQYRAVFEHGEWTSSVDYNKPWIFVETEHFKEISEKEFVEKIKAILD